MRPLPVQPLEGAPPGVAGVALIRGRTCPVVDLGSLFGSSQRAERFVLLRFEVEGAPSRLVALAVRAVDGVEQLARAVQAELPPLLSMLGEERVDSIAVLDQQLMLVLKRASWLDESAWEALGSA